MCRTCEVCLHLYCQNWSCLRCSVLKFMGFLFWSGNRFKAPFQQVMASKNHPCYLSFLIRNSTLLYVEYSSELMYLCCQTYTHAYRSFFIYLKNVILYWTVMFVSAHVALNLDTLRWIFLEHQNQFQSTEGLGNKSVAMRTWTWSVLLALAKRWALWRKS